MNHSNRRGDQRVAPPRNSSEAGEGKRRRKRLKWTDEEYMHELLARREAGDSIKDILAYFDEQDAHISEPQAYKFLQRAKKDPGLIKILVVAPRSEDDDLRKSVSALLRERYRIRHVEVVGSSACDEPMLGSTSYWSTIRSKLGALAAAHTERLLARQDIPRKAIIALSGGRSASGFVEALFQIPAAKPRYEELVFRPCTLRSHWRALSHAEPSGVVQRLVHRFGYEGATTEDRIRVLSPEASPVLIHQLRNHPSRELWGKCPEIDAVVGPSAPRPHLIVTGIGHRWYVEAEGHAPHRETSRLVCHLAEESFYFDPSDRKSDAPRPRRDIGERLLTPLDDDEYRTANERLFKFKVVAELFGTAITANGSIADEKLDQSALGVRIEHARIRDEWIAADTRCIGMAGCSRMVYSLLAGLAAGCFTDLVLDSAIAVQILRLHDKANPKETPRTPKLFRDVPLAQEAPKVAKPSPTPARART